jgi:integrase
MSVRNDRHGGYIIDTRWPDGIRTRRRVEDKKSADAINRKIDVAVADEERIWKKLRKSLRLEQNQIYSVCDLVRRYMDEYVSTYNIDIRHKKSRLASFAEFIGNVSAERIDLSNVSRFLAQKKQDGLENATLNRYREVIAHMTSWATDQGIFENDPLVKLKKFDEPEYYPNRPDYKIIDAVLNEIDQRAWPIFCFMRETGCRKGEAITLRPEQVDYSRQVVTFHTNRRLGTRTKNGKTRQVPLTSDALAAIQSVPRYGPTVFYHPDSLEPWRDRTLDYFWDHARRTAAASNPGEAAFYRSLRMHDLRHVYAVILAESGCEMHFISEVLGHYSIEFTRRRYARFSPDSAVRRVLTVLEGRKGTKRAPAV